MDKRTNAVKKESEKLAIWPHVAKGKSKKKWRSNLLIAVVGFNRTLILDKSYRKSNELYFRVADCRLAINKTKKLCLSIYRLEWIKIYAGG